MEGFKISKNLRTLQHRTLTINIVHIWDVRCVDTKTNLNLFNLIIKKYNYLPSFGIIDIVHLTSYIVHSQQHRTSYIKITPGLHTQFWLHDQGAIFFSTAHLHNQPILHCCQSPGDRAQQCISYCFHWQYQQP